MVLPLWQTAILVAGIWGAGDRLLVRFWKGGMNPVYCKDCGSQDSWERVPERDIKGESGRVMWARWKCRVCGAETLRPVEEVRNEQEG